jgi:hypothetical protein
MSRAKDGLRAASAKAFRGYDALLRAKNRGRPRVLVYADSRGVNLLSVKKTHYIGSYIHALQRRFDVTYWVLPHSHTTIVDFLNVADRVDLTTFDHVVLHCGIVDFSPRPISNIAKVQGGKQGEPRFDELFAEHADYYAHPWDTLYEGEPTINLYSPAYLNEQVLPALVKIPNLIWISSNHFVAGWDGNYTRGRPANIDQTVHRFEATLHEALPRVVDLSSWSDRQVREMTIDNLHLTRRGFQTVRAMLDQHLT